MAGEPWLAPSCVPLEPPQHQGAVAASAGWWGRPPGRRDEVLGLDGEGTVVVDPHDQSELRGSPRFTDEDTDTQGDSAP